jgi:hydroxyethylthiazole kinase-like uncharacterized protein yjeF
MTEPLDRLLSEAPLPAVEGGKDSRGNLLIVGGAPSCPGAAILAGLAALRCGAGRVQLVVHPAVAAAVGAAFPEALVLAWDPHEPPPAKVRGPMEEALAVIVGPGLGDEGPRAAVAVSQAMGDGVLVVDAKAIPALSDPALADRPHWLAAPNPKEAADLLGERLDDDGDEDDEQLAALAERVAKVVGGPAAVRGALTVVDDAEGRRWSHRSGVPGLGAPGSGDVLVGALGGFLARGASPLTALAWAVAVHARAGALLAADHPVGFLAREVADTLPAALHELRA